MQEALEQLRDAHERLDTAAVRNGSIDVRVTALISQRDTARSKAEPVDERLTALEERVARLECGADPDAMMKAFQAPLEKLSKDRIEAKAKPAVQVVRDPGGHWIAFSFYDEVGAVVILYYPRFGEDTGDSASTGHGGTLLTACEKACGFRTRRSPYSAELHDALVADNG